VDEVAKRLHTFKFKEPRIVGEVEKDAEEKEKKMMEKYFEKRFKGELTAKELRPKYTEKFI
jgi:hypothetical protein